jgi:hypothetical protein
MADYTDAALRGATVRLNDGEVVVISYVPAGEEGWLDPVIRAWDIYGDALHWELDGSDLGGNDAVDIVEILE